MNYKIIGNCPFCDTELGNLTAWNGAPEMFENYRIKHKENHPENPIHNKNEEEKNQCDGCMKGMAIDQNGNHMMGKESYNLMGCTKDRYIKPREDVTPEVGKEEEWIDSALIRKECSHEWKYHKNPASVEFEYCIKCNEHRKIGQVVQESKEWWESEFEKLLNEYTYVWNFPTPVNEVLKAQNKLKSFISKVSQQSKEAEKARIVEIIKGMKNPNNEQRDGNVPNNSWNDILTIILSLLKEVTE